MKTPEPPPMPREKWKSTFGFIMATSGFAVGVGNIWRFPYVMSQSGGGAFLLAYLVLALLIGIPLLTAEVGLGRKTQRTPIAGFRLLCGKRSFWNVAGWLAPFIALLIMGYYLVILAWLLQYVVDMAQGSLRSASVTEQQAYFAVLKTHSTTVIAYAFALSMLLVWLITRGVQKGVERSSKICMPFLLLMLLVLAVGGSFFEGAREGLQWYLSFDLAKLGKEGLLAALGQVFFSIGVGMAVSFTYGSYLDAQRSDVPTQVTWIVLVDTAVAILAGFVIFPPLFAFGMHPEQGGAGLLFVTMTTLFAQVPAGQLIGTLFFFLVLLAGFTSMIGFVEGIAATLMDSLGLSRIRAVSLTVALTFLLSIPNTLSAGAWKGITLFGKDIFTFMDFFSASVLLPLSALLLCFYVAYAWGFERFKQEVNIGSGRIRITALWKPLLLWVIPLVVLFIFIQGIWG